MKSLKTIIAITSSLSLVGALVPTITSCSCSCTPKGIQQIIVSSKPNKTNYAVGEKLDLTGLVVTAFNADYSLTQLKADQYTTSIADQTVLSQKGKHTIKVDLIGTKKLSSSFDIYVTDAVITKIEMTKEATKWSYNSGETLDLTGMEVTATYSNGTKAVLDKNQYKTLPAEGSKVYEQEESLIQDLIIYTNDYANTCHSEIWVTSAAKSFNTASWDEITKWVNAYYTGIADEEHFCKHFSTNDKTISTFNDFLGETNTVAIDGINHTVEIIGVNHDDLEMPIGDKTKSLFTFRFKNILTATGNNPITVDWDASSNKNYLNSTIKTYLTTTVLNKIPTDVKNIMKSVKKTVLTGNDYSSTTYNDKLFLPTKTELGYPTTDHPEGTKYSYFTPNANQLKLPQTDGTTYYSYWLATPDISAGNKAYRVGMDGIVYSDTIQTIPANAIAPFFCI